MLLKFSPSRLVLFFENSTKIVPESETSGLDNDEDFEDFITVDDVTTAENKQNIKQALLKEDA